MKISTKIISLAALATLALAPVSRAADNDATPSPPPAAGAEHPRMMKHMRENRMKQLDENLHLTAEQKTQIKAIWDKAEEQGRAMRNDATVAKEDRKAKRRELMEATHQQVRTVLTPDQQKIFDTLPAEMPRGGPRGDGPPPPPAPAKSD